MTERPARQVRDWPERELQLLVAYYCLEGQAYVCTLTGRTPDSVRQKASRLQLRAEMNEYSTLTSVARQAGTTPQAVHAWLRRTRYRRHCRQWGRHVLLPTPAVRLYLQRDRVTVVPRRPRGWPTVKQAAPALHLSERQVRRQVAAGQRRAVRHRGALYLDPQDVTPTLPDPALVPLAPLARQQGFSRAGAKKWMQRHHHHVTRHRSPTQRAPADHVSHQAALAFTSAKRHARNGQRRIKRLKRSA